MSGWRRHVAGWRPSRRRRPTDPAIDDELAEHLQCLQESFEARGIAPDEARRLAHREFGNVTRIREDWQRQATPLAVRAGRWWVDLKITWRALERRPGSSAGVCLVAALGVGLTSAMFVLVDPYLLKPLPYADPDALVHIAISRKSQTTTRPVPRISDWQIRTDLFDGLAAYAFEPGLRLRLPSGAAYLPYASITANLFDVLGVPFRAPGDWRQAAGTSAPLPLLTPHRLAPNWLGRVSRAPELADVGRTLSRYPDGSVTLVGRAPAFKFPRAGTAGDGVLLALLEDGPVVPAERQAGIERAVPPAFVGRLRTGTTVEQVNVALMTTLGGANFAVDVLPLDEYMTRGPRPVALGALAAGLLIFVVCTANVANVLTARATYRARETLTRVALGARRRDLLRLHLFEAGVFVAATTALAVGISALTLALVAASLPPTYTTFGVPSAVSWRAVAFAGLASSALFAVALVPVLASTFGWPRASLAEREATDSKTLRSFRFALTSAQCAVAVMLLTGAVVLSRSFINLVGQATGWHNSAVNLSVIYPESLTGAPLQQQIDAALDELRRLPGVTGAAAAVGAMANGFETRRTLFFGANRASTAIKLVTPDYFEVTGTVFRRGRTFTGADRLETALIVNDAFVAAHFPGRSGVGEHVSISQGDTPVPIVGVVGDTHDLALDARPEPTVFAPLSEPRQALLVSYVVGTNGSPEEVERVARASLARTSPDGVLSDASRFPDLLRATVRDRILATRLLQLFAIASLSVTCAGLAALVAFVVGRRRREIAIRLAIGARAAHIRRLVANEVLLAAACGGTVGLLASWSVRAVLASLVYGIAPADLVSFVVAAVTMVCLVASSAWAATRPAVRVPPVLALRSD